MNVPVNVQDARNNIGHCENGDIVFPAAGVAVVMSRGNGGRLAQKFYTEHTDNILCLRMHPDRRRCATGQVSRSLACETLSCEALA